MNLPRSLKVLTVIFEVDVSGELVATVDSLALPDGTDECAILAEVYGLADQTNRWYAGGNGPHLAAAGSEGLGE